MKQFLLDFYQRLGINKAMAEDLEAITFAMIIFVLALLIWLVTRRVFRLIFSNCEWCFLTPNENYPERPTTSYFCRFRPSNFVTRANSKLSQYICVLKKYVRKHIRKSIPIDHFRGIPRRCHWRCHRWMSLWN